MYPVARGKSVAVAGPGFNQEAQEEMVGHLVASILRCMTKDWTVVDRQHNVLSRTLGTMLAESVAYLQLVVAKYTAIGVRHLLFRNCLIPNRSQACCLLVVPCPQPLSGARLQP